VQRVLGVLIVDLILPATTTTLGVVTTTRCASQVVAWVWELRQARAGEGPVITAVDVGTREWLAVGAHRHVCPQPFVSVVLLMRYKGQLVHALLLLLLH
jgi:hypothetical protein